MMTTDHRMGITPIVLRRAAYYATLGIGEYCPEHPHFDAVRVTQLYPMSPNPIDNTAWAFGVRVEFALKGHVTRWVEFSSRVVGAGGDDILKKVDVDEE
jgi:hypothetical protein